MTTQGFVATHARDARFERGLRGFVGTWEVLQPTLKRFVIHEPDA